MMWRLFWLRLERDPPLPPPQKQQHLYATWEEVERFQTKTFPERAFAVWSTFARQLRHWRDGGRFLRLVTSQKRR
ncbi:hypothetical protein ZHAS_00002519 [Anopheles sinensis]|uniref:Uncharacterized protein n=1 Tax=Anopheles sinensis TaxID=74873 RepID=A0A084VCF7_ANOSI|nr:hypothetical protein ZHAS_00002519 [Anopheles sinensis]